MNRFSKYTSAQIKRSMRYLPFVFIITLAVCAALALFMITTVNTDNSSDNKQKLKIGVAGSYEDTYLGFGLTAIQSFDSSRFALEIIDFEEKDAIKSLKNGEISGYVLIPEGFIENAIAGKVGKLSFVTSYTDATIINIFKEEALKLVSCIIVESQKGVYAMQDAMQENGAGRSEIYDETLVLSAEYINLVLNRTNALELKTIGVSDNLSFAGYLFSGLSIILIFLSGIVTAPLYIRRDASLYKLLRANRYNPVSQIVGEYLSFFALMFTNSTLLLLALMLSTGKFAAAIPELASLSIGMMLLLLLKFIPTILLISSLQFLMYQISDSIVSGVLMQFFSAVLLGYACGCFYPINFFPELIQKTADFIPHGIARAYLSSLLTENVDLKNIILSALYFLAFLSISVLVRYRKIKAS